MFRAVCCQITGKLYSMMKKKKSILHQYHHFCSITQVTEVTKLLLLMIYQP